MPFRPAETLAGLLDRPDARAEAVGPADGDAARAGDRRRRRARAARLRPGARSVRGRVIARVPSYEVSFRAFVESRDPRRAADRRRRRATPRTCSSAIREGRLFTSVDGVAGLSAFEVVATSGTPCARPGEYLESRRAGGDRGAHRGARRHDAGRRAQRRRVHLRSTRDQTTARRRRSAGRVPRRSASTRRGRAGQRCRGC